MVNLIELIATDGWDPAECAEGQTPGQWWWQHYHDLYCKDGIWHTNDIILGQCATENQTPEQFWWSNMFFYHFDWERLGHPLAYLSKPPAGGGDASDPAAVSQTAGGGATPVAIGGGAAGSVANAPTVVKASVAAPVATLPAPPPSSDTAGGGGATPDTHIGSDVGGGGGATPDTPIGSDVGGVATPFAHIGGATPVAIFHEAPNSLSALNTDNINDGLFAAGAVLIGAAVAQTFKVAPLKQLACSNGVAGKVVAAVAAPVLVAVGVGLARILLPPIVVAVIGVAGICAIAAITPAPEQPEGSTSCSAAGKAAAVLVTVAAGAAGAVFVAHALAIPVVVVTAGIGAAASIGAAMSTKQPEDSTSCSVGVVVGKTLAGFGVTVLATTFLAPVTAAATIGVFSLAATAGVALLQAQKEAAKNAIKEDLRHAIALVKIGSLTRLDLSPKTFNKEGSTVLQAVTTLGKAEINQLADLARQERTKLNNSKFKDLTFDFDGADINDVKIFLKNIHNATFSNCTIKNLNLDKIFSESPHTKEKEEILRAFSTVKFKDCKFEGYKPTAGFLFKAENITNDANRPSGLKEEEISPCASPKAPISPALSSVAVAHTK